MEQRSVGSTDDVDASSGRNARLTPDQSRLVEEFLPLVNHVVFQVTAHFPRHVDRIDLARAGALGLVEAARRYTPDRGVPFDRFAAQRIRGAIIDATRQADWAPRSVRTLARRLDMVEQQLAAELGRVPDLDEMAAALGTTRAELAASRERIFRSVVLAFEHIVSDDVEEGLSLLEILPDEGCVEPCEELEDRELRAYMRDAVRLLPDRQRTVIIGYYLEGRTSADLARFLGVTESRVSQIRSEALANLRRGIEAQYRGPVMIDDQTMGVARRRDEYAAAISTTSAFEDRLSVVLPTGSMASVS